MPLHYLIAYDIASPKRLRRVAKVLVDFGLRVQKSVFVALLDERRVLELKAALARIVDPDEDSVAFMRVCRECLPTIAWIGARPPLPSDGAVVV